MLILTMFTILGDHACLQYIQYLLNNSILSMDWLTDRLTDQHCHRAMLLSWLKGFHKRFIANAGILPKMNWIQNGTSYQNPTLARSTSVLEDVHITVIIILYLWEWMSSCFSKRVNIVNLITGRLHIITIHNWSSFCSAAKSELSQPFS